MARNVQIVIALVLLAWSELWILSRLRNRTTLTAEQKNSSLDQRGVNHSTARERILGEVITLGPIGQAWLTTQGLPPVLPPDEGQLVHPQASDQNTPISPTLFRERQHRHLNGLLHGRKKKWCDGVFSSNSTGAVRWVYDTLHSACPRAIFFNCSKVTREDALHVLHGKHILLIGDSVMRFQYLNLVTYLHTGHEVWPQVPYAEMVEGWGNWTSFLKGTNMRLGGSEVCDCFRGNFAKTPNHVRWFYENRYWFGPGGVRVTYIQHFGINPVHWHNLTQLGIQCWEAESRKGAEGNFSTCKQQLCLPGECHQGKQGDFFTHDVHLALPMLCESLQPDIVIQNTHYWVSWNNTRDAELLASTYSRAGALRSGKGKTMFVWKTGTPSKYDLSPASNDNLKLTKSHPKTQRKRRLLQEIDSLLVARLQQEGHRVFNTSKILQFLPRDLRQTYTDPLFGYHFCPHVNHGLNQALLMLLTAWLNTNTSLQN